MKTRLMIAMIVMMFLLQVGSSSAFRSLSQFEGIWVNVDANTRGITKIIIDFFAGVQVHAFGSCTPTDCDWGIASEAYAYGPSVDADLVNEAVAVTALYQFGFSTTLLVIQPSEDEQLVVQSFTHFLDNSQRTDYTSTAIFQRGDNDSTVEPTPPPDCEAPLRLVDFEDVSLGSRITNFQISRSSFQPQYADISAHEFFWSSGSTTEGFAEIENGGLAGGSGHEVEVNNVNLAVSGGFGRTINYLRLQFGEYGGNLNLQINDQSINFDNFADLHNISLGGVNVNVISGGLGNDQGVIEFTGDMSEQTISGQFGFGQLLIGGQELWIDNICYSYAE